jgi:hypothetical protein
MAKKLQSNFIRRIEKTLTSVRPQIPTPGTNHVDDASSWTSNMVYKGELGINYTCGTLWTQDGQTGLQPNTENAILEGLVLSNVGVSGTYLAVSNGYARLKGRTYVYNTPSLSNPSSITIQSSSGAAGPRIDTIVATPGTTYNSVEDLYELEIQVIKGDVFAPGCSSTKLWPPQVDPQDVNCPSDYVLLGFVYVPANLNQATTPLYPLAVVDATIDPSTAQPYDPDVIGSGYFTTFPLPTMTTNAFIRTRQRSNFEWQPNTLYFEKQLVYIVSSGCGTLYEVSETYQSSSSSATDISSGYLVEFCGVGPGTTTINTFADIGYPPSAGVPSFSDGYFSDWDSTTRIIDSIAYLNDLVGKLAPPAPKTVDNITLVLSPTMSSFGAKSLGNSIVSNVVPSSLTPAVAITPNGSPFKDYNENCPMFGFFNTISTTSGTLYDDDPLFDLPGSPTYYSISPSSDATTGSMQIEVAVATDISKNPMLVVGRNLLIRSIDDPGEYFYVVVSDPATWSMGTLFVPINDSTSFSSISGDFAGWEIYIAGMADIASLDVGLNAAKVDPYENIDQKNDVYTAFSASVETVNPVAATTTKQILGINYKGVQGVCDFYVENPLTPSITVTSGPQGIHTNGKYLSGVPVLSTGDTVFMSFDVQDAVNYFYNKDRIVECMNSTDFNPYILTDQDADGGAPSTGSPWPINKVLSFSNNNALTVSDEACSDGLSFNLLAYNSRGTEISDVGSLLVETNVVADSGSQEVPTVDPLDYMGYEPSSGRYTSGSGTYPTGDTPILYDTSSSWGDPYDSLQSTVDLSTNEELQLGSTETNSSQVLCGYYFFPDQDYSSMDIYADTSATPVSPLPPDYSGLPSSVNDYRWATFYVGYVETATRYLRLRIVGGENINEVWDGLTMTPNFQFQVKIFDPDTGNSTGWLDGNTAYDPSIPSDPYSNGDAALDASFGQGALFRRITFGQTARKGTVWVRVGVQYYDDASTPTNMRFRGVSLIDSNSAVEGDGWEYIDTSLMPTLSHIQYLVLGVNGSNFPVEFSDPDSPNTMTPGLELQVRLNGPNGTDWISANDAYDPGVVADPYNLGDAALDASLSTQSMRRVTFGSVVGGRSGELNIRYRIAQGSPVVVNTIILEDYS